MARRLRPATAAAMALRRRLLTRSRSVSRRPTGPSTSPVSGSTATSAPPSSRTSTTRLSALRTLRLPVPSASKMGSTAGSPVAASAAIAFSAPSKPPWPSASTSGRSVSVDVCAITGAATSASITRRVVSAVRNMDMRRALPAFKNHPAPRGGPGMAAGGRRSARRRMWSTSPEAIPAPPTPWARGDASHHWVAPPHLPVATLKFPHFIGARQSEIRSLESGR